MADNRFTKAEAKRCQDCLEAMFMVIPEPDKTHRSVDFCDIALFLEAAWRGAPEVAPDGGGG